MSETVYTTTKMFSLIQGERVVSVDAGTGTVVIACQHGAGNWIDVKIYSADTVEVLDFGLNRTYRFTITGDATYAL